MANYDDIVTDEDMVELANAIRDLTGGIAGLTLPRMITELKGLVMPKPKIIVIDSPAYEKHKIGESEEEIVAGRFVVLLFMQGNGLGDITLAVNEDESKPVILAGMRAVKEALKVNEGGLMFALYDGERYNILGSMFNQNIKKIEINGGYL